MCANWKFAKSTRHWLPVLPHDLSARTPGRITSFITKSQEELM